MLRKPMTYVLFFRFLTKVVVDISVPLTSGQFFSVLAKTSRRKKVISYIFRVHVILKLKLSYWTKFMYNLKKKLQKT